MVRALAPALLGLALAPGAPAQDLLWERVGVTGQYQIGRYTIRLDDLDGDGWAELLHSAFVALPTLQTEDQLWVLSGRDGTTLQVVRPPRVQVLQQLLAEAGDVDGDGLADYAVRVNNGTLQAPTSIEVRSGRDHRVLWSRSSEGCCTELGTSLLGDLDVNGDGRPDLVATSRRASVGSRVLVFSHEGELLYSTGQWGELIFGWFDSEHTLGKMGDVDGDGCDDFVVGGGSDARGAGVVLSGRTGAVLTVGYGPTPFANVGHSVAGCGDLDGDRVPDFVAGNDKLGPGAVGIVAAYSGRTGEVIHLWTSISLDPDFEGTTLDASVDVDRDGVSDIQVGVPVTRLGGGKLFVLSGRDGSVLYRLAPTEPGNLGATLAGLGTSPGSPFGVFAGLQPTYGSRGLTRYQGRIRIYRGSPVGVQTLGQPCAGTLEHAPRVGMRQTATGTRVTVYDAPAGTSAWLLVGLSRTGFAGLPLPAPLDDLGFPGCVLRTSIDAAVPTTTGTVGIDRGYAAVDLPGVPVAQGLELNAQWLVLGHGHRAPGGLSDALGWQVQ